MRRTLSRPLTIATLAAAVLAWTATLAAAGPPPGHVVCRGRALSPHSPADAIAHCGPKPTSAGPWRCIGDQRAKEVSDPPHPPKCEGYEPATWSWRGPQVQYQDNWTAPR